MGDSAAGPSTRGAPRLTPYELVFDEAGFPESIFREIEREATVMAIDSLQRDRFAFLRTAEDVLREIVPEDSPPEVLDQFRALLFHAYNFWRLGEQLYVVEPAVARFLVESSPPLGEWSLVLPHASAYVQLPTNLFWASVSPDSAPEPVDGFFVAVTDRPDPLGPPAQQIQVLLVLGIRRNRAGFSVIPLDTEAGSGIVPPWGDAPGRDQGNDFSNVLPGGDIEGLYSILTTTEILKLLARVFWYVEQNPHDVLSMPSPDDSGDLPVSRLPYHRIRLSQAAPERR